MAPWAGRRLTTCSLPMTRWHKESVIHATLLCGKRRNPKNHIGTHPGDLAAPVGILSALPWRGNIWAWVLTFTVVELIWFSRTMKTKSLSPKRLVTVLHTTGCITHGSPLQVKKWASLWGIHSWSVRFSLALSHFTCATTLPVRTIAQCWSSPMPPFKKQVLASNGSVGLLPAQWKASVSPKSRLTHMLGRRNLMLKWMTTSVSPMQLPWFMR